MFNPAYSELLDTNQDLRVKELEQCYRTISIQDNTIIVHEKEIEKLKSKISDLRKQLRVLQQDKKFKDEVGSIQDGRIIELENKVGSLKARIRILIDKKISINALDMTTTNLIANVNRGLDRIENHIRGVGTPMQNPANVIDAERDQYQNILNDTNNREWDLRNQLRDNALNDENRQVDDLRNQLHDTRNQYINAYWGLRNNWQLAQNRQERQILALQNNPLLNMANVHLRRLPLLKILNPNLRKFQSYTSQEPPDEYLDKVIQSWAHLEEHMTLLKNANTRDFDNTYKCEILKSMMEGKYTPVPANNGLIAGNPAKNSPDTLWAWMRAKYQRETVGNQQSAIQRLTQERFHQLSGDLYTWMRIANPAGIDAFFTELKNLWLKCPPNLNGVQTSQNNTSADIEKLNSQIASLQAQLAQLAQVHPQNNEVSANFEKLNSKIASLEAQLLAESMQVHSNLAQRLQLPENVINSNSALTFDRHINQELEKRLGVIKINLAKLTKLSDPIFSDDDTSKPEDNDYNSDNSSAGSDSRKHDMNVYITHGKKNSKVSNQSKPCEVKQDINISSIHNALSEKDNQGTKQVSLEEIIRKIIQIEFKNYLPYIIQQLVIDTKEKHDLRGIATTPTESLGIVRNVPVNFAPRCTIYADFAVVKYLKPMLILPNTLLDKYNYDLLASKRKLRLECNGKEFFIPINMHKVKNKLKVNCANVIPKCNTSLTLDKISQDLSDDDTLKKSEL
ncbi:hypothetical protein C1646_774738 [Rhizophagus diaphanus]|nr:hypothetical protein C1646_774738 [Rhizophagus diaphanus] [Rhizophagus sp. MUCL 43196]